MYCKVFLLISSILLSVGALSSKKNFHSLTLKSEKGVIDDWKCGNWCGANNGAFYNSCKSVCFANNYLTADCLKCLPAKDEIDLACARHDICSHKNLGNQACGGNFHSCECDMALMSAATSGTNFSGPCSNPANRALITTAFTVYPCGCRYSVRYWLFGWRTKSWSMCVPGGVCKATGGS